MIFEETPLAGAFVIRPERRGDERGFFARAFCQNEFEAAGLGRPVFVQANVSRSVEAGTLRGLHFQTGEHAENKLVRCTHGSLYDAMVDLRSESPTYLEWFGMELSQENGVMLWVPAGFAHGFYTKAPDTEIFYQVTAAYAPGHEGALRWNDPAIKQGGIDWPGEPRVMSERDRSLPDLASPGNLAEDRS